MFSSDQITPAGQGGPEGTVCAGHDKFGLSIANLKIFVFFWKTENLRCPHSLQIVIFDKHFHFFAKKCHLFWKSEQFLAPSNRKSLVFS